MLWHDITWSICPWKELLAYELKEPIKARKMKNKNLKLSNCFRLNSQFAKFNYSDFQTFLFGSRSVNTAVLLKNEDYNLVFYFCLQLWLCISEPLNNMQLWITINNVLLPLSIISCLLTSIPMLISHVNSIVPSLYFFLLFIYFCLETPSKLDWSKF